MQKQPIECVLVNAAARLSGGGVAIWISNVSVTAGELERHYTNHNELNYDHPMVHHSRLDQNMDHRGRINHSHRTQAVQRVPHQVAQSPYQAPNVKLTDIDDNAISLGTQHRIPYG